jgi:alkylation response protein AidB-like acyl-CoA dehydrogenase
MDLSWSSTELAFAAEVRAWLADHLEQPPPFGSLPEEVAWGQRWQAELAGAGWVAVHWPRQFGGRSAPPVHVALFNAEYARAGAPQLVNRVGINLAGPTLLAHGTPEQQARWLPPILTAEELWCQLFSEPGAGSDLASLTTRATPAEGGWMLNGQKVWTSYAQFARWGICLARTAPDHHRGISFLVVDMTAPGITVRPLVQLTGEAEFNEVFFDDVFVPADQLVGGLNEGWAVATTTLAHERGVNFPIKEQVVHEIYLDELYRRAADGDLLEDEALAEDLAQAYVEVAVLRLHNWRTLTRLGQGISPGPESSVVKLTWTEMTQHLSEVGLAVMGPGSPLAGRWARQWLWSKAASIAGGTSEIQRTIIGERLLGLPRP